MNATEQFRKMQTEAQRRRREDPFSSEEVEAKRLALIETKANGGPQRQMTKTERSAFEMKKAVESLDMCTSSVSVI